MLKLRARWEGKCRKHPRFNPEKHGLAAIKGNCTACLMLIDIHTAHISYLGQLEAEGSALINYGGRVKSVAPSLAARGMKAAKKAEAKR
jgi:hypothetical protein